MAVQIGRVVCAALTEGGTIAVLFAIGKRDTGWSLRLSRRGITILAALCAVLAVNISRRPEWGLPVRCLLGILAGSLLAACAMDLWECMVYRFVWWVAGASAGCLFLLRIVERKVLWTEMLSLILFAVLQYGLFGKMYGRADCSAFCVCAAAFRALGGEFADSVIHMAVTFGVLMVVQGFRKNIATNGNLKKPVPLVPYITAAFWFWVDFMG